MFYKGKWVTGCVDYSDFPLQMCWIGLGTTYNCPHGTYRIEVCRAEEELVPGMCSHLQCLLRHASHISAAQRAAQGCACWPDGRAVPTTWIRAPMEMGAWTGTRVTGYTQTPSPSMCPILLPSQVLHSYKEKEQVGSNMVLRTTQMHPWFWGISYLVLLLGHSFDCLVDGWEDADSSVQEEQKQQPLLFLTTTSSGT